MHLLCVELFLKGPPLGKGLILNSLISQQIFRRQKKFLTTRETKKFDYFNLKFLTNIE